MGEPLNILVVEDNESDLFLIREVLEKEGYNISVCYNGTSAIDLLINNKVDVELVLLDYRLPDITGIEILKSSKEVHSNYSFIFLSADSTLEIVTEAMREGAMDFIVKSKNLHTELPEKIKKVLSIHSMKRELNIQKEKVRFSEQRYRELLSTIFDGFLILDSKGNIADVNGTLLKLLGYSREELLQMKISDLDVFNDENIVAQKISNIRKSGKAQFDTQHRCKDGRVVDVEVSVNWVEEEKVFYTFVRDISEKKQIVHEQNKMIDQLKSLWNLSKVEYPDIKKLTSHVLEEINVLSDSIYSFYGIVDDKQTTLTLYALSDSLRADCNKKSEFIEIALNEEPLFNEILKEKRIIIHNELGSEKLFSTNALNCNIDVKRIALIPVCKYGKIQGIAGIINKRKAYSIESLEIVETFLYNAQVLVEQFQIREQQNLERFFLKRAQEIGSIGTWQIDIASGDILWTEENYKLFGVPLGTKVDFDLFVECIHPDDREYVIECWNVAIQTGVYDIEHRVVANGKVKWLKERADFERDSTGNYFKATGVTQDITKEKETEQKIEEQQILFDTMFNTLEEGVVIANTNREIILANKGMKSTFDYDPDEIIGESTKVLYASPDKFNEAGSTVFDHTSQKDQSEYITMYKKKDGEIFPGETFGAKLYDSNGKWIGNLGIMRDVTERIKYIEDLKLAKRHAEESEQQFSQLFDNLEQGFALHKMYYDENGKPIDYEFILINKAFENLTRLTAETCIGKRIKEVLPLTEDVWIENYGMVAKTGKPIQFENYAQELGKYYNVVAYSPKRDYFAVVFTDVTKNKEYEQELIAARIKAEESDKLKTMFLNNMSHEVRTPMNGIIGFSELLLRDDLKPEKRRYFSQIIVDSSKQLLRIIDDILEISRLETKQIKLVNKEFNLNDFMMEIFSIYNMRAQENNVPVYLKKGLIDSQSNIVLDKSKLHKILTNLIDNALKFTFDGFVEFGYQVLHGKILEIYVKDTGVGIKPENIDLIFKRFSQEEKGLSREYGGLGIGLSIAKENARILGGDIIVESEKGEGSNFILQIPDVTFIKENIDESSEMEQELINEEGKTILIAEDETVNYLYLQTIINEEYQNKIKLLHARNGLDAVKFCREQQVDMILMDIKMPLLNGIEATKQILSFNPSIPIIAQTAYSSIDDKEKILQIGCLDLITKPVDDEELFRIINTQLF